MRGLPIGSLRRGLKALIPGPLLSWRQRFLSRRFREQDRAAVFTAFYRENLWASLLYDPGLLVPYPTRDPDAHS